jgi:hypothetical protein
VEGFMQTLGIMTEVESAYEIFMQGGIKYRYRIEFTRATGLAHFILRGRNKIASGDMKTVEWKEPPE